MYVTECIQSVFGEHVPKPGDINLCLKCGAVSFIQEDLTLKQATEDELKKVKEEDPEAYSELRRVSNVIARMNRKQ